jgi:hypothetical protein
MAPGPIVLQDHSIAPACCRVGAVENISLHLLYLLYVFYVLSRRRIQLDSNRHRSLTFGTSKTCMQIWSLLLKILNILYVGLHHGTSKILEIIKSIRGFYQITFQAFGHFLLKGHSNQKSL